MTSPFTILSKSEDGKLNGTTIRKFFDGLKPGRYELSAKRINKRSLEANGYYWGVVVPLTKEGLQDMSGEDFSKEEVHHWLKGKFNYTEIVNTETGECEQIPRSTASLNKSDFYEYVEKIRMFAAQYLNVNIPDPGQQLEMYE